MDLPGPVGVGATIVLRPNLEQLPSGQRKARYTWKILRVNPDGWKPSLALLNTLPISWDFPNPNSICSLPSQGGRRRMLRFVRIGLALHFQEKHPRDKDVVNGQNFAESVANGRLTNPGN